MLCSISPDFFVNECDSTLTSNKEVNLFQDDETVDFEMIDAILISHSQSLIMLPYITEVKKFFGRILAPAPILRLGKVLIDDLFAHSDLISSSVLDSVEKKFLDSSRWLLRYSREQATSALSKIQSLAYHQYVNLFGLLKVKCISSGYEIGSCNWIMKTDYEKIAYISRSSLYSSFAIPLDFSEFQDVDVLIVGAVNTAKCLPFDSALQLFKTVAVQTLARGGHVMVPVQPSGLIYHLFDAIEAAKAEFDGKIIDAFDEPVSSIPGNNEGEKSTGTAHVGGISLVGKVGECPCYFISAAAKASLAYANAFVEWLVSEMQIKTEDPHPPFAFDERISKGRLVTLSSLHSSTRHKSNKNGDGGCDGGLWSSCPTIFFSGHPSCRVGSAFHLIRALSLGVGRQRPTQQKAQGQQQQQQGQIQQWSNLNALILVQSDEFSPDNLDEHERLRNLLQPLGNYGEVTKTKDSILGVPICRLGVGLTAYWLPIRTDISINQLPALLKKFSPPKQALILPMEAVNRASGDLPSDFIGIKFQQSLDIQLTAPKLLRVHVNPEVLMARSAFTLTASSSNGAEVGHVEVSSEKDPRKSRSGNAGKAHVGLVQGKILFRDGKYRLDPPPREVNGSGDYNSRSPQTPPKRSGSPVVKSDAAAVKSTAKLGCYRLLLAPKEVVSPLTEYADRLVKQLTVFGVTGAQIIAHNGTVPSDANLELKNFIDRYRSLNQRLSVESLPVMEKDIDAALIVFPNSTTTILLTEAGTFITCADEGTRLAIKNAVLASAPQMVVVPNDSR
ncbi:hypothetical protein Aperf_G00000126565 [Anoplocephala perfoliata]